MYQGCRGALTLALAIGILVFFVLILSLRNN